MCKRGKYALDGFFGLELTEEDLYRLACAKAPQDKLALAATLLTIVGYVCAGAGVLGFILWLAADGDGISRFATALGTLVTGLGLGGLNYGLGAWLGERRTPSS